MSELLKLKTGLAGRSLTVFMMLFAVVGGIFLLKSYAATNPITTLSDGTIVHRGNSVPAGTTPPLVIAAGHNCPQCWENITHFIEAADTYGFAVALPDFSLGGPVLSSWPTYTNGGNYVPNDNHNTTVASLGFIAWANAVSADPHRILLSGFSAGAQTLINGESTGNDPAGFTVIAINPVSGFKSASLAFNRTSKTAIFHIAGTADAQSYTGANGVMGSQAQTELFASLNGWNGTTAPTITAGPAGTTKPPPYVVQYDYNTGTGPPARYWLITAGNYPTIGAYPESGGGNHVWPGGYAAQNSTPAAGDNAFHATDAVSQWFMSIVNGSSGGSLSRGDLNGDGHVDVFDLSILLSDFGTSNAAADINNDGKVDIFDLSILLSNYGT